MKKTLATILIAATAATMFAAAPAQAGGSTRVIDGDTIDIDGERIRIQGIDTPEAGEPCFMEAKSYLQSLVAANGGAEVVRRDGTDRYGRTIGYVSTGDTDVGLAQIKRRYAVARYDSIDGYQHHPKQDAYRAESNGFTRCESPQVAEMQDNAEQPEDGFPFWSVLALEAVAADNGFFIDWDDIDRNDRNHHWVATTLYVMAHEKHEAELREQAKAQAEARARQAERDRQAEAERQRQRESQRSSSGGSSNSGYTGPRCYAPGGKSWRPCP